MKKVLLVAVIAGFAMTSCKKNYTCTCNVPASGGSAAATYTYELKKVKKKDAKASCNAAGSVWILAGGTCDFK